MSTADAAVVGAGPVGLTAAVLLGQRGWRVDVFDRQAAAYPLPRAVHVDQRAARVLDAAGVMAALATETMDAYEWRNAAGATLLRFEGTSDEPGWPVSSMFAQPDLERLLAERLASLDSVRLHRGLDVADPAALDATWVLGCDGAASTVRPAIGATVEQLGESRTWLIVDVVPDRPAPWVPLNLQVCDPARPTTAVSGGPGRRRFEFLVAEDESPADLAHERAAWALVDHWGLGPANAHIERLATYTFAARLAAPWGTGRMWLAGDAAHQMPPFAGQGLCAGLRDAASLAWRIDALLAGSAGGEVLADYETEQAAQVRTIIELSVDLGRIICAADPDEAAARDQSFLAAGVATVPVPDLPPLGPGTLVDGDPTAGTIVPQGLDADIAGRWTLVAAPAVAPVRGWLDRVGGTVLVAHPDSPAAAWLGDRAAALVRPDLVVFGSAAEGCTALLDAARTALGTPAP